MRHEYLFRYLLGIPLLFFSCKGGTDEPPEPPGPPAPTEEEYTYIAVDYRKKSGNGFLPWSAAESSRTRTIDGMNRFTPATDGATNAWGGRNDRDGFTETAGKTGFFRLGRIGRRWYFIDPDGGANILRGTQHVKPCRTDDNRPPEKEAAFAARFGDEPNWAEETGRLLAENGFNCLSYGHKRVERFPAGIEEGLLRPGAGRKMAYAENLYLLRTFMWDMYANLGYAFEDGTYNRLVLLFEPTFLGYIDELARRVCAEFVNDRHLVGYYLDNELPFNAYRDGDPVRGIELAHFLSLPDRYRGARGYAERFLEKRGREKGGVTEQDRTVFRDSVANYYFEATAAAVRRHDPNHLILGSRLHERSKYDERTVRACASHCDVVSVNYYGRWEPEADYTADLARWAGPFMVTEFYTKAADAHYRGAVYENLEGGGWLVAGQRERGDFYQNFCLGLLESGNCVGWHHFQYNDTYGSAALNANKGIVSVEYSPYGDFLERMKQLHVNTYRLADYFDAKFKGE
jgi:hypothetical protein